MSSPSVYSTPKDPSRIQKVKRRVRYGKRHNQRAANAKSPSKELSNKTNIIRRPIIFDPIYNINTNMIHFYIFHKEALMLISDHPKEKIKAKYGPIFEIVNSVKDKESLELVKPRIVRQYPKLTVVEDFYVRKVFSEETREKLRQKKLGRPRADWVRQKISSKMKGKSNFEGKEHNVVSKKKTSLSMQGKTNTKGKIHIYNPYTDHETMIDRGTPVPEGYRLGRDPESIGGFMSSLS